jgi:hypothetical protein
MDRRVIGLFLCLGAVSLTTCANEPPAGMATQPPATAPRRAIQLIAPTETQATAEATAALTPTSIPLTATPAPTTTDLPAETLLEIPAVTCCRGRGLDAGRYRVPDWLGIPLAFEAPAGWRVLNEEMALLLALGRGENEQNNPNQLIVLLNASTGQTAEGVIAAVGEAEQLDPLGEPVAVTVAGFPGVQVDMAARPNPTFEGRPRDDIPAGVQYLPVIGDYLTPGFAWTTSTPEARVRAIALTIGEQILLLYLEAPPGEMEQLAADAEPILESLEVIGP